MKPPSAMLNISFGLVGDEEGLVAETVAVLDCIVEVDPGESERERERGRCLCTCTPFCITFIHLSLLVQAA